MAKSQNPRKNPNPQKQYNAPMNAVENPFGEPAEQKYPDAKRHAKTKKQSHNDAR